jgi:hypothetical protein
MPEFALAFASYTTSWDTTQVCVKHCLAPQAVKRFLISASEAEFSSASMPTMKMISRS